MRLLPLLLLLFVGCYPYISPQDAVVSGPAEYLGAPAPSGATYSGEREVGFPVPPFRLWGLDFDEEMLFELGEHDTYGMIEITHVRGRGYDEWFALVSEKSGVQHVAVGSDRAFALVSTFPAPVYDGRLRVIRLASESHVEYVTAFHLPNGELVQATLTSKLVGEPPPQRNGNAMNHSADRVLAVLDLEEYNWATPVVFVEGERARVRLLAPFLPLAWRLEQTAGGVSWGGMNVTSKTLTHDGVPVGIPLEVHDRGPEVELVARDTVADQIYRYRRSGDALELVGAEVRHGEASVVHLAFNPPLPDLRWKPTAETVHKMVAGSNGQEGYMVGEVRVRPDGDGAQVDVLPAYPFWACERPIRTGLEYGEGLVRLRGEVAPSLAAGGAGRDACFDQDRERTKSTGPTSASSDESG
ncbi:MAG: hypothetical protein GY898_10500 [Proteobacteria bacterium]|nr:hypothetical protein [Pseudomonadota bacterium]